VIEEIVSVKERYDFVDSSVAEVGNGCDDGYGDEGADFHSFFDCFEDAVVLSVHCAHYRWV